MINGTQGYPVSPGVLEAPGVESTDPNSRPHLALGRLAQADDPTALGPKATSVNGNNKSPF